MDGPSPRPVDVSLDETAAESSDESRRDVSNAVVERRARSREIRAVVVLLPGEERAGGHGPHRDKREAVREAERVAGLGARRVADVRRFLPDLLSQCCCGR